MRGLDVPMLGEVGCLSYTKESYQRRCVMVMGPKRKWVLKAISPRKLLAGVPCGGNSEAPNDFSHMGAGAQSNALALVKVFLGSPAFLWSFIHPHLSSVHVKRDKKELRVWLRRFGVSTA